MAKTSSLVGSLLVILVVTGCTVARTSSRYYQMWPGDVMIGGLYGIHNFGIDYSNCTGDLVDLFVILAEAHVISLQYVNEHILASINMTMGTRIWDSCNSAAITLQHCVNFIDPTEQKDHGICGSLGQTSGSSSNPFGGTGNKQWTDNVEFDFDSRGVLAVTGAFSSNVAKNVNYLMQAFCIPVVGTTSSSSEFDDMSRYPFFLRTCPSDKYRAQVIFDTLQARLWMHVTVLYDSTSFGFALKKEFQSLVDICSSTGADLRLYRPPCIERYIQLPFGDEEAASQLKSQQLELKALLKDGGPRVLLLFMEVDSMKRVFQDLEEWQFHGNNFQFVVANGIEFQNETRWNAFMNNTLSVEHSLTDLTILKHRLQKTTLDNSNSTWMKELIALQNNCSYSDSDNSRTNYLIDGQQPCLGNESLLNVPSVALKQARLIFEAINVIAHSVKDAHEILCKNVTGHCQAMKDNITGQMLYERMLRTHFKEDNYNPFQFFNDTGDLTNSAKPFFDIYQYQSDQWRLIRASYNPCFGPGRVYHGCNAMDECHNSNNFTNVYDLVQPELWKLIAEEAENCQKECHRQYAYMRTYDQCCWTCKSCTSSFEIVNTTMQQCEMCPENTLPEQVNLTECIPITTVALFAKPTSVLWVLLGLCVLGVLLSAVAGFYIYRNSSTPMVRASTPDLCYLQAGCLVCMFSATCLMLPTSSVFICGFSWALSTSLLALCHTISTVKALRICRPLFYTRLMSHMTHSQSSTILISGAMFCHCLIIGLWLVLRPPSIHRDRLVDQAGYYDWCSSSDEGQTIILFFVPLTLLLLSSYFLRRGLRNMYMFQVRQTRIAFAGALCFFANYAVLLPFIFMQTHEDVALQSVMLMCVPMLTGFVSWATMLFPVIYVLVFKSRQNKREYITRERSRQFTEGNMMYFVDAVILKNGGRSRNRTLSNAKDSIVIARERSKH